MLQNIVSLSPTSTGLPEPYLLFLGDTTEPGYAKTAFGLRDWAPDRCIGEFSIDGVKVSTGLTVMTPAQARVHGTRAGACTTRPTIIDLGPELGLRPAGIVPELSRETVRVLG